MNFTKCMNKGCPIKKECKRYIKKKESGDHVIKIKRGDVNDGWRFSCQFFMKK